MPSQFITETGRQRRRRSLNVIINACGIDGWLSGLGIGDAISVVGTLREGGKALNFKSQRRCFCVLRGDQIILVFLTSVRTVPAPYHPHKCKWLCPTFKLRQLVKFPTNRGLPATIIMGAFLQRCKPTPACRLKAQKCGATNCLRCRFVSDVRN